MKYFTTILPGIGATAVVMFLVMEGLWRLLWRTSNYEHMKYARMVSFIIVLLAAAIIGLIWWRLI